MRITRLVLAAALAATSFLAVATPANASTRILYVRVGGTGDCSSSSRACGTIDAAFNLANAGDHIQLAGGTYTTQTIKSSRARSATFTSNVVIEPVPGTAVTLKGLRPYVHNLTVQGLAIKGVLHTDGSVASRNLRFANIKFVNATAYLNHLQGGAVVNSVFRDGVNRDALNIKENSVGVVVAHNTFKNYRHDPSAPNADLHVDCIQAVGVYSLTLDSNSFTNCAQRALILQTAVGYSNDGAVVINNDFGPCNPNDNDCQTLKVPFQATGKIAADRKASGSGTAANYTIVNNHIVGWAYVEDVPGLKFANNILDRFFNEITGSEICGRPSEWNNLVSALGKCTTLAPSDQTTTQYSSTGDLGFADPGVAPPVDMDGTGRCGNPDVGSLELQCSPTVAWGRAAS